jgi:hypothetical protein
LSAFTNYLDRVIRQCRSCADSREAAFAGLKTVLSNVSYVTVTTAGALRSSTIFVEERPLMDQPNGAVRPPDVQQDQEAKKRAFRGELRLSAEEAKRLSRCVMILDAVIRHNDHSNANSHNWRAQARSQPLKGLLSENSESHPALRAFVFETRNRGIKLDFEAVLSELVEVWSAFRETQLDREHIRSLVNSYYPVASAIKGHDQMVVVFETARKHVSEAAI